MYNMAEETRPIIKQTPNKYGSSSLSRKLKNITIPQPFKLSSNDSVTKQDFRHSKCCQVQREMDERQKNIEAEYLKQFRANPIPAHTFLPLFQEIQNGQAKKNESVKQLVKAQHITKQKPFDLSCYKTMPRRSQSVSDLNSVDNHYFRAKPLPKQHDARSLSEIMAEQEILREIRRKRRAEQLLKASALPFSIPRETLKKHKYEKEIAKLPISRSVPSSPKMKSKYSISQHTLRLEVPLQVNKTTSRARLKDYQKFNVNNNDITRRRRSASFSALEGPTPRMTYGAILREQANRERCKENVQNQEYLLEKKKELLKLKRDLLLKITYNQPVISKEEKLRHYREANQARMKEYLLEMQKMAERVKARPYLVERQSQLSAVQKLDKKFRDILRRQGLDEDFIIANSKQIDSKDSASLSSEESESESNSFEAEIRKSESQVNTSPETSKYSVNAHSDEESQVEEEEEEASESSVQEESDASHTELPERDIS